MIVFNENGESSIEIDLYFVVFFFLDFNWIMPRIIDNLMHFNGKNDEVSRTQAADFVRQSTTSAVQILSP